MSTEKLKQKHASLTGYSKATNLSTLMKRIDQTGSRKRKGDWRRYRQIRIPYNLARVVWSLVDDDMLPPFTYNCPVPYGLERTFEKSQSVNGRSYQSMPFAVKQHFDTMVTNENFQHRLKISVSFENEEKFEEFYHIFCRHCEEKILPKIWEENHAKLPADATIENLFRHWDSLAQSWMHNDILGCIIPNIADHYIALNGRRFVQRPEIHFNQVHADLAADNTTAPKKKKTTSILTSHFSPVVKSCSSSASSMASSSCSSSSNSTTSDSSIIIPSITPKKSKLPKLNKQFPKTYFGSMNIRDLMDPQVDLKTMPKDEIQRWALGSVFKMVHQGANKCQSNAAVVENYSVGHTMVQEYHSVISGFGTTRIPLPPKVRLNQHNINDVHKSILDTYRYENQDSDNPYRQLEQAVEFGLLHDATSYWAKQLNTVFLRVVESNGQIHKVPFSMRQVAGSFTGEALAEELLHDIVLLKKVDNNAAEKIEPAVQKYLERQQSNNSGLAKPEEQQYKCLHNQLKEAAAKLEMDKLGDIRSMMVNLVNEHPHLEGIDICNIMLPEDGTFADISEPLPEPLLPKPHPLFKIAKLVGIDDGCIYLEIDASNLPTTICGDGCAVNLKGSRLLKTEYGLVYPSSKCASHLSSGTVRRLCTSENSCQDDAKMLYQNLRKVLLHFAMSPKSSGLLSDALAALEFNDIHLLNWGSTRMAGFLDACLQSSKIIVPFLDTVISAGIRPDEVSYLSSPKGLCMLQLFADIHQVFANEYLHNVDSDKVLVCETYEVAHNTADKLLNPDLLTPKADAFCASLHVDEYKNIHADFDVNGALHSLALNAKLTNRRNNSLDDLKSQLVKLKNEILQCMADNIKDQNKEDSLSFLMSAFNLMSDEDYDSRLKKIEMLYDIYGTNHNQKIKEEWGGFQIDVTYKKRIICSKSVLVEEFEKTFQKMNTMSKTLRDAANNKKTVLHQMDMWQEYLSKNEISCPNMCVLVRIMLSIPPNTGWVERAYSKLELICQKRRNRLGVVTMMQMFFLAVLKSNVKDCFSYDKEIENVMK